MSHATADTDELSLEVRVKFDDRERRTASLRRDLRECLEDAGYDHVDLHVHDRAAITRAKETIDRHAGEAKERWSRPLWYLVTQIMQYNREHWLLRKPKTQGADTVRRRGLTNNQYRWIEQIEAEIAGDRWWCPHCGVFVVGTGRPDACPECDEPADELQDATVRYVE